MTAAEISTAPIEIDNDDVTAAEISSAPIEMDNYDVTAAEISTAPYEKCTTNFIAAACCPVPGIPHQKVTVARSILAWRILGCVSITKETLTLPSPR